MAARYKQDDSPPVFLVIHFPRPCRYRADEGAPMLSVFLPIRAIRCRFGRALVVRHAAPYYRLCVLLANEDRSQYIHRHRHLMGTTMLYTEQVERSRPYHRPSPSNGLGEPYHRHSFHHARTSLGAAGHFLHISMMAAPLVIGEVIHDSEKRWRAMRMVPVLGALASELLWTLKIAHDREKDEEARAALQQCRERCR